MHRLAFLAAILAPVLLSAPTAAAQTPPSFDCARASTAAERAICDDFDLSWLDAQLGTLYAARRHGPDAAALRDAQRDWLAARNRCGHPGQRDCLLSRYGERLGALAAPYDGLPATGIYNYDERYFEGALDAVLHPDGTRTLAGRIWTVNMERGTSCTVEFAGAALDGDRAVWRDPEDILGDGTHCTLAITFTRTGAKVAQKDCAAAYCGVGAVLSGGYARE